METHSPHGTLLIVDLFFFVSSTQTSCSSLKQTRSCRQRAGRALENMGSSSVCSRTPSSGSTLCLVCINSCSCCSNSGNRFSSGAHFNTKTATSAAGSKRSSWSQAAGRVTFRLRGVHVLSRTSLKS